VCDEGSSCIAGACTLPSCPTGQIRCDGACVDPERDRDFCGASADCTGANAGATCVDGEVCVAGVCATSCPSGQIACDGACVDPERDRDYCGASADCTGANAGATCVDGEVCVAGACATSCPSGQIACDGACIDPERDRAYCGASADCTGANAGATCVDGEVCVAGACATSCPRGQIACDGACIDPLRDRAYCGASADCTGASAGEPCGAGEVCNLGSCETSCPSGQIVCGGRCVDPTRDATYCGASGDCAGENDGTVCVAGEACSEGACATSCPSGQIACGGACVDPSRDAVYCGASGDCTGASVGETCGAGTACVSGACVPSCGAPLSVCGEACVDTRTSPADCGSCGMACGGAANATPVCRSGSCAFLCELGFQDCNGRAADGCEASFADDEANCGGCGVSCELGESCNAGRCEMRFTADANLSTQRFQGTCADGGDMVAYRITGLNEALRHVGFMLSAGCLSEDDRVLLIDIEGPDAGTHDVFTVAAVAPGGTRSGVVLREPLRYSFTAGTFLVRVPTYTNVVVSSGVTLTANGRTEGGSGVFAMAATESLTVAGTIDMDGRGYAGAPRTTITAAPGVQGSSTIGAGTNSQLPNGGGGGGGSGEFQACLNNGTGGGGGGHSTPGSRGSNNCSDNGGLAYAAGGRIFLGAGGGAGGTDDVLWDNPPGGRGGNGGGAIVLYTPRLDVTGTIRARGLAGEGDRGPNCEGASGAGSVVDCWDYSGPGGGGAGGSFFLIGGTHTGNVPDVSGGAGGFGAGASTTIFAGNGGQGGAGVVVLQPRNCFEARVWTPTAVDGAYTLDADGVGPLPAYTTLCDMTRGGWTMLYASGGSGSSSASESTEISAGSRRYLPVAIVRSLAAQATQVHIRTQDRFDTESITSVANGRAIQNLRLGLMLNQDAASFNDDPPTQWTGPFALTNARLRYSCGYPPFGTVEGRYPTIYHACGNAGGLHLTGVDSGWTVGSAVPLELYVR
jgi:hypothetical protein